MLGKNNTTSRCHNYGTMNDFNPDTVTPLDAEQLQRLLAITREHRDELAWILMQHERLRHEYLSFLKRDLPDMIKAHKQGLFRANSIESLLSEIVATFRADIIKSFEMLDGRYAELVQQSNKEQ